MGETIVDSDQIRISVIRDAYERGMRHGKITPDMQIAQWLAIGLKRMEENQKITPEEVAAIDKMGGTDHPDPFIRLETKLI